MRPLIFIGVLIALAPSEIEERWTRARRRTSQVRERFWRKYDEGVSRILDGLEERGVYRTKDYGTTKP